MTLQAVIAGTYVDDLEALVVGLELTMNREVSWYAAKRGPFTKLTIQLPAGIDANQLADVGRHVDWWCARADVVGPNATVSLRSRAPAVFILADKAAAEALMNSQPPGERQDAQVQLVVWADGRSRTVALHDPDDEIVTVPEQPDGITLSAPAQLWQDRGVGAAIEFVFSKTGHMARVAGLPLGVGSTVDAEVKPMRMRSTGWLVRARGKARIYHTRVPPQRPPTVWLTADLATDFHLTSPNSFVLALVDRHRTLSPLLPGAIRTRGGTRHPVFKAWTLDGWSPSRGSDSTVGSVGLFLRHGGYSANPNAEPPPDEPIQTGFVRPVGTTRARTEPGLVEMVLERTSWVPDVASPVVVVSCTAGESSSSKLDIDVVTMVDVSNGRWQMKAADEARWRTPRDVYLLQPAERTV